MLGSLASMLLSYDSHVVADLTVQFENQMVTGTVEV